MSRHGHGGIRRRLIGSVADQVIRRAPAPVIVTGPQVGRADIGVARTLLAGFVGESWSALAPLLASWAPLLGATVEVADIDRGSSAEPSATSPTGQPPTDRSSGDHLVAQLHTEGVRAAAHLLPRADPISGLRTLADRLPPPVLLAIDSQCKDERVPDDVAYRLIRTSRWPVLASLGT